MRFIDKYGFGDIFGLVICSPIYLSGDISALVLLLIFIGYILLQLTDDLNL